MLDKLSLDIIDADVQIQILEGASEITEHTHEFIEIEYVMQGECIQYINGKKYEVKKGDVMFFNIGDSHSYKQTKSPFKIINILFYPKLEDGDVNSYVEQIKKLRINLKKSDNVISLPYDLMKEFEAFIDIMKVEQNDKKEGYALVLKNLLSVLIIKIIRNIGKIENENQEELRNMLLYIENNYIDITPSTLAKSYSYSPAYFSKIFKIKTGVTIIDYINKLKIDESIRLLKETNLSVENVCKEIGFTDKKHFYDLFKRHTGLTPSEFRKNS